MAEGVLEDLLGGEEEKSEAEVSDELRAGADAFAIAVAVDQFEHHPRVAAATEAFLETQARLIEEQTAQLRAERPIRLHHLHGRSREGRLRRMGQRIRLAMQLGVAVLFAALGAALVSMVYSALTSHAVVVEAFDTPPALAPRGLSGKVVASALLDGLQTLADATRSADAGMAAQNAWSSNVQIEVPETGVSIGEIDRFLHERLGHDLHVGGDLIETAGGGLALTVRGDGLAPKTFVGGPADLEKLTTAAAEYTYGSSQPYRFAVYLNNKGRNDDALAFLPKAFAQARTDALRSRLANTWGNVFYSLGKPREAIGKYRVAIALDGDDWLARSNLVNALPLVEGEEAGWRASQDFLRAVQAAPAAKRPPKRMFSPIGSETWDLPLALQGMLADAGASGAGISTIIDGPPIADTYALMHDPIAADRYIAASDPNDPTTVAETLMLQAYGALDRNDAAAAIPPLEKMWRSWQANTDLQTNFYDSPCYLGLAYGLAGRLADAEALFKKLGPWNRCFAFHGETLAHAGDMAGAERAWSEGERLAPDLPWVDLERGRWAMNRGDLVAAASHFAAAHAHAPHFADPLKAGADVLARQGKWAAAVARYDKALDYAPHWEALKQARAAAARRAS